MTVKFSIDGKTVEAEEGSSVMDAAREAGIMMPSMCYKKGHAPQNSCLTCVVKVNGNPNAVPSCSRPVEEGLVVESETDEVRRVRKTALELILSDHVGDCYSPCSSVCPSHMEIPQMLRQVSQGDYKAAINTVKRDIPFPGVMGRVCPEVCEGGCRRGSFDTYESICMVERFTSEQDMLSDTPYFPEIKPTKNKKVAIVGAGLSGLSAAYYLCIEGYQCTVYEKSNQLGGRVRAEFKEHECPESVYKQEFSVFEKLNCEILFGQNFGEDIRLEYLEENFDAIVIATGKQEESYFTDMGFKVKAKKPVVDRKTLQSAKEKVFFAGIAVHGNKMNIFSIASGKNAAVSIDQFLQAKPLVGRDKRFNSRIGKMQRDEIDTWMEKSINRHDRYEPETKEGTPFSESEKIGFTPEVAQLESARCLHCDCRAKDHCDLRDQSEYYDASQKHYSGKIRPLSKMTEGDNLHLDAGKCLQCGLCVQISEDMNEPIGLAYRGRGFDTQIVVPFNESISKALTHSAKACIEACPTGAIEFKEELATYHNPFDKIEDVKLS